MKSGVTLSMIVRDEQANLRRCLESAADFVDHILIIDTGSSDGTIQVAEEFGSEVHRIEWPEAFDEARNYGFERVKTQWTLWLDADEWLYPESGPVLREAIRSWEASAYFVTRIDQLSGGATSSAELVRLWRTHPAMRVYGVLHENFLPIALKEASDGRPVLRAPIYLGHDGYIHEVGPEKLQRNIRLLRKHVCERGPSFYHEAQLYFSLKGFGDEEGDIGFRKLAEEVVAQWPAHSAESMAPVVLGSCLLALSSDELLSDLADQIADTIESGFPFSPAAMWEAHKCRLVRGEADRAKRILVELQRRGRKGEFERVNPFNPDLFAIVDAALLNWDSIASAKPDE